MSDVKLSAQGSYACRRALPKRKRIVRSAGNTKPPRAWFSHGARARGAAMENDRVSTAR